MPVKASPDSAEPDPRAFSRLIRSAMAAAKYDYRSLAAKVGVSHTYIWQLSSKAAEKKPRRPRRDVAVKLAQVLEIDVAEALRAAGYETEEAAAPAAGVVKYTVLRPDAPTLVQRGLQEAREGHYRRGAVLLQEAVSQGGISFVRAHTGLGVAYLGSKDFASAIQEFDRAIACFAGEPAGEHTTIDGVDLADIHYNRGLAYQERDDHHKAVSDFAAAIRFEGRNLDLYFAGLAFSNLALGRFRHVVRDGLAFASRVGADLRYTTASLDVRLYQAYALARLGQFEAALAAADAVFILCPEYWYSSFVTAAICSRFAQALAARAGAARGSRSERSRARAAEFEEAAIEKCEDVLRLNPAARTTLRAEIADDFGNIAGIPRFVALLGEESREEGGECA